MSGATVLEIGRQVDLQDRYTLEEGPVLLTGIQAIVRLVLDQMRADRRAGLTTGGLVSGYPGSPLGGLDVEVARQRKLADELRVVHRPAVNEELGATAVWGSQLVAEMSGAQVDGVLGVWYGKAPGVDRASDAFRHGNYAGAAPKGGMLAMCGDDPQCKSSTLPSESESGLAALRMPVMFPGSPEEILQLGRHAIAASRASGLWLGMKIGTQVADAVASVEVTADPGGIRPVTVEYEGAPYVHVPSAKLSGPWSLEMERTLAGPRLAIARAYARENRVNAVTLDSPRPWLGIVAAGTSYLDMREALRTLGLDEDDLRAIGVRILKLGMIWPLEEQTIREFASGLEEIVVVEDKGPFVESQIRDLLYHHTERPRVLGKLDEQGRELMPSVGIADTDVIAKALGGRLQRKGEIVSVAARLERLARPTPEAPANAPARLPFFCSGCPHNRSTDAPDDALVGAGIGCSGMALLHPEGKGELTGLTQMGGEGVQWIGQAPFVDAPHMFQNLGDGTFHHSGSLAIRAAAAAGVNITFKLLYNSAVAMTGGQDVPGALGVPDLTRWLKTEGARRVVITTEDPGRYRGVDLADIAEVRPRGELMATQEELRRETGLTILIHDQACAAENRRLRKRGKIADPKERIFINERVCEGCGDCGHKSHCLSLIPSDTEFGRKTQIDQSSCNKDYSCLDGDCPSFLEVVPGERAEAQIPTVPVSLPEPDAAPATAEATLRMMGIGGTGVVTVSQVLSMAAMLDGKRAVGVDQTGLAQKGGPVVSDVRILPGADDQDRVGRAPTGSVDGYLAFDMLGATSPLNLLTADPQRTVAVVSTHESPTAGMVGDPSARFGEISDSIDAIEAVTRAGRNVYLDAHALSESLFDDLMPANTIVLGAAWQRGLVPISLAAVEEAFRLNGAAVEKNLAAFHWGRAAAACPDEVAKATIRPEVHRLPDARVREIAAKVRAGSGSELERLTEVRVGELIEYQGARLARRYVDAVREVHERERLALPGSDAAAEAVARGLHKLMAYKDEYEVARLHLDPVERARLEAEFGKGARIKYKLHPPVLRALGMHRKIGLGPWFDPVFGLLRRMRRLRGTPLDPFGYAEVRRVERALPGEYLALVRRALPALASDPDTIVEICELPDLVRGYEDVKLRNVAAFRERAAELALRLED